MLLKKLESQFAAELKGELNARFPGCFIYKLDPNQVQGIPDLLVLYRTNWVVLETKRAFNSARQPNQPHYVAMFDAMSYSTFVDPSNMDEVLADLERVLNR